MNYYDYNTPFSTYGFNITFINNDDELRHVLSLIDTLSNKRDDPKNNTIEHDKLLYLVNAYNMEIKWLQCKCDDYYITLIHKQT